MRVGWRRIRWNSGRGSFFSLSKKIRFERTSNFLEKFFKTIWNVCTRFLNFVLSVFREDFFSVVQLISLACQVQIFKLLN